MDIDRLTSVLFVVALAVPRKPQCTSMVMEQIVKFVSEFCSTNVLPWLEMPSESRVKRPLHVTVFESSWSKVMDSYTP